MGQERMPVNIFSGLLPGAYNFIDNAEDVSKWANPAWDPVEDAQYTAWGALTAGDANGYFGKGINFSTAALAANGICGAGRSFVMYGMENLFLGFTMRPDTNFYSTSVPNYSVKYRIRFRNYNAGSLTTDALDIDLSCEKAQGASKTSTVKWELNGGGAGAQLLLQRRFTRTNWEPRPWWRVVVLIQNRTVTMVKINNQIIATSYLMGGFPASLVSPSMIQALCYNSSANLIPVGYDIDQIWISDTENLV